MPRKLTKEEMAEAQECFSIYQNNNKMQTSDLGNALRSVGINPSEEDVKKVIHELGNPPTIPLETYLDVLSRDFGEPETEEEIREAFGVFDRDGNGTISATELKHVLMTMGEKLSAEEVDIMIREADIDGNGQIHYDQFIAMMKKT
ncbi:unnamed protein product [Meganyctiphanes norvegica]|uniref:EF-hand domain-containing protein n=1 Tax=Meganyctiphanes norvegica TaxID=48144 RepID=A0AAV2R1M2_MEGNR